MIEFSCHSWTFNDLTLPEAAGTIARLGFRYIDLGSGIHVNVVKAAADPRRVATEIISDLRVNNLQLADVYLMMPNIASADDAKRRYEIDLFKTLVPFIRAIGARGVTLSPGVISNVLVAPDEDDSKEDSNQPESTPFERSCDALQEMVDAAEDLPVSIEPHLDSIVHTPEQALELVEAVAGLSITLDWAHMVCQNVKHAAIVDLLPHTRHVHMRQAARNKLQTAWDQGKIDVHQVLSDLLTEGFDGVISVEYMKTVGWHGMAAVNAVQEAVHMRDALRDARDSLT